MFSSARARCAATSGIVPVNGTGLDEGPLSVLSGTGGADDVCAELIGNISTIHGSALRRTKCSVKREASNAMMMRCTGKEALLVQIKVDRIQGPVTGAQPFFASSYHTVGNVSVGDDSCTGSLYSASYSARVRLQVCKYLGGTIWAVGRSWLSAAV